MDPKGSVTMKLTCTPVLHINIILSALKQPQMIKHDFAKFETVK